VPEWKAANRDEFGFPLTKNGKMSIDQKLEYLLEEISALHKRVKSLENSLMSLISRK